MVYGFNRRLLNVCLGQCTRLDKIWWELLSSFTLGKLVSFSFYFIKGSVPLLDCYVVTSFVSEGFAVTVVLFPNPLCVIMCVLETHY